MGWLVFDIFILVAGYVASIYTWPKVRTWLAGVDAEIDRLKVRIKALSS